MVVTWRHDADPVESRRGRGRQAQAGLRPAGFTLIEIAVVLAVVGLITLLALPSFGTLLRSRFSGEVVRFEAFLRRTQAYAIAEREIVRLHYLPEENRLQAEVYHADQFEPITDIGYGYRFGPDLALEQATRRGRPLEQDWSILHWPDGQREPTSLRLRDPRSGQKREFLVTALFARSS